MKNLDDFVPLIGAYAKDLDEVSDGTCFRPLKSIIPAKQFAEDYFKETGEHCLLIERYGDFTTISYPWPECAHRLSEKEQEDLLQIYVDLTQIYEPSK